MVADEARPRTGEEVQEAQADAITQPVGTPRGGWVLPNTLRSLDLAGLSPRPHDMACSGCGSAVFVRLELVRLAQGYQDGQRRGWLFVCARCGQPVNQGEIELA